MISQTFYHSNTSLLIRIMIWHKKKPCLQFSKERNETLDYYIHCKKQASTLIPYNIFTPESCLISNRLIGRPQSGLEVFALSDVHFHTPSWNMWMHETNLKQEKTISSHYWMQAIPTQMQRRHCNLFCDVLLYATTQYIYEAFNSLIWDMILPSQKTRVHLFQAKKPCSFWFYCCLLTPKVY